MMDALQAELTKLRTALVEARKVVLPFAKGAKIWNMVSDSDMSIFHYMVVDEEITITINDFRAAAEWLAKYLEEAPAT
jgi:ABC-type anion transport system duplicated permease subunit